MNRLGIGRTSLIGGVLLLITALHLATPVDPPSWHWLHLLAQKLYVVPILFAAAWSGAVAAFLTTAAASLLLGAHVLLDWSGLPMVQAEQAGSIVTLWIVAVLSSLLFDGARRAAVELRLAHDETLRALASSLELRERNTAGHSRRVRDYALLLADEMGLTQPAFRTSLAQGAFLHDIGKIGIPDRILLKEGALTGEEWGQMRQHAQLGASLIGDIALLEPVRELVRSHHERYDGLGYPEGLAAERIPLAARVFAVADAYDALTADRPYRRAVSFAEAAKRIASDRGAAFDPAVVDALLRISPERWASASSADCARRVEGREDSHGGRGASLSAG